MNDQEQVQLTMNDIAQAVNIIDAAVSRGAFRGKEVAMVGHIHDRLSAYVEQNKPAQATEQTNETQPKSE